MTLERKTFACAFKQVDLEAGTFEGHASIFHAPDDGGDIVMPGAFAKTIQEWGPAGANRIKVLALHRSDWLPIGKPLELQEDEHGLFFTAKVSDTALGRDMLTLIRDGVITEMSIGFQTIKAEQDRASGLRLLRELRLFEFSPVIWAMHPQALITGVKDSETDPANASPSAERDPEVLQSLQQINAELSAIVERRRTSWQPTRSKTCSRSSSG